MSPSMPVTAAALFLLACAAPLLTQPAEDARQEVFAAERAFAQTMSDRDPVAFASFISEEAIFFGPADPLRGKQQVVEGWAPFFEGVDAPFSWEPQVVEVLDSGTLALSSGPVRNRAGDLVAQFTSIWRREPDGAWRVVFDKGCELCARNGAGGS